MKDKCLWTFVFATDEDGYGFYESACGQAMMLHPKYEERAMEIGLNAFGFRHCIYCGRPITEEAKKLREAKRHIAVFIVEEAKKR